ncbi:secreted and spore coat-associated protein 3 [Gracilibacillus boraciitolerans JCM 21714]|uniref:Secreted and spore coat-associated protein 3 n=1 Tax=Gracilibacillus boraciitolerans JCM 21714 TaxID=1298598 RepID=W4VQK3_9BACI|nr:TasA family protein [Gracilibacillus boraciitolerans]GAE95168.1 secreted and spore coat-associated protein 3 [Gracilibacillus boraciitolerans JCM 21714]
MSLKKKLGLGMASAALGLALVGGGTYAYFSDEEVTNNTFAAGTLDLSVDPTTIIEVSDIKPGDWMYRSFELINDGTLDIYSININTDYTTSDYHGGDNTEDFGEHILVHFVNNYDKGTSFPFVGVIPENVIWSTTLAELKADPTLPDAVANDIFEWWGEDDGLKAGDTDSLDVLFEFVDNGEDQNQFQADKLKLTWTFEAQQTAGESK